MDKKPTVTGVFVFLGLLVGAIAGNWLPYAPSFEALVGGIAGGLIGFAIDKIRSGKPTGGGRTS